MITWLKPGDHNTSFFHRDVQIRRAKNYLRMIQDANDVFLTDPEEIKLEAVDYFKDFLQSPHDQEEADGTADLSELVDYEIAEET